ncbi:miraculin-like [Silene latifolia]|uniref:miraculin-like n=1 Tax=Silene latifolia TaxID=37657 RepID=UPI003D783A6B
MSPIFLLLLSILFLSSPTTTTADIVLDFEGDPLVAGSYYFAMPIAIQKGGGLTMFNNGSVSCPSFIVARSTKGDMDFGIPIRFSPQTHAQNKNIYLSSSTNIAFKYLSPQPLCRRLYTTVWTVSETAVVLDGEEGSDGSWFKLEEYGDQLTGGYKILYGDKTVLYDQQGYGEILLGFEKGNPLLVVFVKAWST